MQLLIDIDEKLYHNLQYDDNEGDAWDAVDVILSGKKVKTSTVLWHPFPQELPPDIGCFLICTRQRKVYTDDYKTWGMDRWYGTSDCNVVAWAELPKPYVEGCE